MFAITISPLELMLRGTLIYLGIFVLLRAFLRRVSGNVTAADLLMMVLIADAAQNAMASDYRSVTDGAILIATLVFWNYALDWLAFRVPFLGRLIHPPPLPLIVDGRVLWPNLRKELISVEELRSHLREEGVDDFAEVQAAHVEGDGRISVVKRQSSAS